MTLRNSLALLFACVIFGLTAGSAFAADVTFHFSAPGASTVHLAGEFNSWNPGAQKMTDTGGGAWKTTIKLQPGAYAYKFVVNGTDWKEDPNAAESTDDGFGGKNSLVTVGADNMTAGTGGAAPAATTAAAKPAEAGKDGKTATATGAATATATATLTPIMQGHPAPPAGQRNVVFLYQGKPGAKVTLAGDFNGWDPAALPISESAVPGTYFAAVPMAPGSHQYKFVIDGNTWKEDPKALEYADDGHGGKNGVVNVTAGTLAMMAGDYGGGAAPAMSSKDVTPPGTVTNLAAPSVATPVAKPAAAPAVGDVPEAPAGQRNVLFVFAGSAGAAVTVAGEFNGWDPGGQAVPETEVAGVYQVVMPLAPGKFSYKFVVNGNDWKEDTNALEFVDDGFGGKNSVVNVSLGDGVLSAGDYSNLGAPAASAAAKPVAKPLGEAVTGSRSVTFSYQPLISGVNEVMLAGTFNDWNVGATPMTDPDGNGTFEATLLLAAGDYQYKFVVDGNWITDENADDFLDDGFGGKNGILHVDSRYDAIDVEVGDGDIFLEGVDILLDYSTINEHADGEFIVQAAAYRGDVEGVTLHWKPEGGAALSIPMRAAEKGPVHTTYRADMKAAPGTPVRFTFEYIDGDERQFATASGTFADALPPESEWLRYTREALPIFRIPTWAQTGIYYQIFPERYANGDKSNDQDFTEPYYDGKKSLPASGKTNGEYFHLVEDWNDVAGLQKSPYRTDGKPDYYSFYGGDIAGLTEKIPYMADLGITIIYFNPITEGRSNHRYDPCDYVKLDPHLGTEDEFKAFSAACLENGIRIIVDMAYNHTGDCHFAFQDVIARWKDSPYYDWYEWKKRPPSYPLPAGEESIDYYDCWWGFGLHPNLNFDLSRANAQENGITNIEDADPNWEVVNYLLSSVDYWLGDMGVSGFRLDVPNEVPFWFWDLFRERCRAAREEHILIGEIWGDAGQWINPNVFDAVMNYRYFKDPVVKWIGQGQGNAATFDQELAGGRTRYPIQAVRAQMNLIDSHDTIRYLQIAGEDTRKLKLAATFGMTYVGAPHIYYGDEVALTGGRDPDCRRTMPWDQIGLGERKATLDHYKKVTALRHARPALTLGSYQTVLASGQTLAYLREHGDERLLVALNNSASPATLAIPAGDFAIADGAGLDVLLGDGNRLGGGTAPVVANGIVRLNLGGYEGVVLSVKP